MTNFIASQQILDHIHIHIYIDLFIHLFTHVTMDMSIKIYNLYITMQLIIYGHPPNIGTDEET